MLEKPFIKIRDLWYEYPGKILALKGINVDIGLGKLIAIIGENGSGKTTLVKHFNGLLKPTRGTVVVDGLDTKNTTVYELSKKVGYVFQNPDDQLFAETVEEEVKFGPRNLGLSVEEIDARTREVLRSLGLNEYRDEYPRNLTRGLKRRVTIASILTMQPNVIVLDEPTTGQDYFESREIMDLAEKTVREEGKTIVIITHDIPLVAEYAERVIVLGGGNLLLDGTPKEVFILPEVLSKTSVSPPQITQLAQMLEKFGLPPDILTVGEFFNTIRDRRR